MNTASKLVAVALVAVLGAAAPALAQSSNAGTGARSGKVSTHGPGSGASRNVGRGLYNSLAPRGPSAINSDDPAATGGGSLGYNQSLRNDW